MLTYEKALGKLGTYNLAINELDELIEASRLHRFNCFHARARSLLKKIIGLLEELLPCEELVSKEIFVSKALKHFRAQLELLDRDPPPHLGGSFILLKYSVGMLESFNYHKRV